MKQTALITGASGGIGRACAVVFAEHGYNLVLVARTERKLDEIKRELEKKYGVTGTVVTVTPYFFSNESLKRNTV